MNGVDEKILKKKWFYSLSAIGYKGKSMLLERYKDIEEIFDLKPELVKELFTEKQYNEFISSRNLELIQQRFEKYKERGIKTIYIEEDEYPAKLKNIYDPPGMIYVKGRLSHKLNEYKSCIGIVGSRKASVYGSEMATYFAKKLAENNIIIISGLARGIDGCSHQGALSVGGYTVGVIGCGINVTYPREHISLYARMEEQGAIISEYGFDVPPMPAHFPLRNRIISGLSDGILVVEAGKNSGSLITADQALEQGRQVYVVPGRIIDANSIGAIELIKQGAMCVLGPEDILRDLDNTCINEEKYKQMSIDEVLGAKNETVKNKLAPLEKIVYSCLSLEQEYIDDIVYKAGLSVTQTINSLYTLEQKGVIKQVNRGYYIISI